MSKKNKINKPDRRKRQRRINEDTTDLTADSSNDEERPSFRFTYADPNRWLLSDWTASEVKDLVEGLKKIEKYNWLQIKKHGSKKRGESVGTGYKLIANHPTLPAGVPEPIKLSEMRIDNTKRIFGFRAGTIYYIIWFDRDHSVCPE